MMNGIALASKGAHPPRQPPRVPRERKHGCCIPDTAVEVFATSVWKSRDNGGTLPYPEATDTAALALVRGGFGPVTPSEVG